MIYQLQNQLKTPKNLRRSEMQDWYFSQNSTKIPVVSRRWVLSSTLAIPAATMGMPRNLSGPLPRQAEAQGGLALIALLISLLELVDQAVDIGQKIRASVTLDNTGNNQSAEGSTVTALYDDREYVEHSVAPGAGLLVYHPDPRFANHPVLTTDTGPYRYERVVYAGTEFKFPVEMPASYPGDKQLEAMTMRNVKSADLKVNS